MLQSDAIMTATRPKSIGGNGAPAHARFRCAAGRKRGLLSRVGRRCLVRPARLLVGLAALLVAGTWPPVAQASPFDLDAAAVAWSRLVFRAAERADDLSVEVTISEVSAADLSAALSSQPGDEAAAVDGKVLRLASSIDVFLTGRAYQTDIWFQPAGMSPLQRRRDKTGDDVNRKIFRYLADGVRRLRIEPNGRSEVALAPELWTGVKEHVYPFGSARDGCPLVTDPGLLFFIASAGAVTDAAPVTLCVFNKKAIYPVQLSAEPDAPLAADYLAVSGADRNQVRREARVRKIRIQALAPKGEGSDPEPFEFFEMVGEIEIDLEADSGLPLRIAGDIAGFGRVEFTLSEAVLRP